MLGLPFSFAHHFMPRNTDAALELYRIELPALRPARPSRTRWSPCAALCADDDERARYLSGPAAALDGAAARRAPDPLPDPRGGRGARVQPAEEQSISALSGSAMIGGPDTVREKLEAFVERTAADELMITTMVHDHADRIRSYELIADLYDLAAPGAVAAATMEDR